ncbi:MAG TPA: hypothetical protein PK691_00690 [Thermomicrobiales bacterium]|nr:hypothetical protein [Thermomicrobiales bacterium]HRA46747.1 hypothetical protein [Thermomicrobiales bacterium]
MKNLFAARRRNAKDIVQEIPASIGASDRELEKLARELRQAKDTHWDVQASQYGFRG